MVGVLNFLSSLDIILKSKILQALAITLTYYRIFVNKDFISRRRPFQSQPRLLGQNLNKSVNLQTKPL
jgi:hypothetical protein